MLSLDALFGRLERFAEDSIVGSGLSMPPSGASFACWRNWWYCWRSVASLGHHSELALKLVLMASRMPSEELRCRTTSMMKKIGTSRHAITARKMPNAVEENGMRLVNGL